MCLIVDIKRTKQHSKLKTNRQLIFYKDFFLQSYGLQTFWTNSIVEENSWIIHPDKFYIDTSRSNTPGEIQIYGGVIHAYVQKTYSKIHKSELGICIPIVVESDDVIAFGTYGDVCFSKYKIEKSSWEMVKRKRIRNKKLSGF